MDPTEFAAIVTLALGVIATAGIISASILQMFKLIVIPLFKWKPSAEFMAIASGALSVTITAGMLMQMQVSWPVAVLASIVAMYSPKVAHDMMRKVSYG